MRIREAAVYAVNIPFKQSFVHALAERNHSESVFVCLRGAEHLSASESVSGWGEALPRDYVSGETQQHCCDLITQTLPLLYDQEFHSLTAIRDWCDAFEQRHPDNLCARAALELALLDLFGRINGRPLLTLLSAHEGVDNSGCQPTSVQYSAPISDLDTAELDVFLQRMQAFSIPAIKLKAGSNLQRVRDQLSLIRRYYPLADIRIDANGAWQEHTVADVSELLNEFNVSALEQPLLSDQVELLGDYYERFKDCSRAAIILDESVRSRAQVSELISSGAADCLNIKISKVGGLFNALEIRRMAKAAGIQTQLGANVGESTLITAAGLLFAVLSGDLRYHEGAAGNLLLTEDIASEPLMFDQRLQIPRERLMERPGLGVDVDDQIIKRWSCRKRG